MQPKLPPALAALLGIQGCIITGPCLSVEPKETGEQTGETGTLGPCLTTDPWPRESGDTGRETGDTDGPTDSGIGPCLQPPLDTGAAADTGAADTGASDTGVSAMAPAQVRDRVLGSGRLPGDVVERLRNG